MSLALGLYPQTCFNSPSGEWCTFLWFLIRQRPGGGTETGQCAMLTASGDESGGGTGLCRPPVPAWSRGCSLDLSGARSEGWRDGSLVSGLVSGHGPWVKR